jgi:hypothetical protein
MKYNFIIFTLIILFISNKTFCQIEEFYLGENLKERVINQKIKEIKGEIYKFANNKIEKEGKLVFLFDFDERGNMIRKQIYNIRKDKIISNHEFIYNKENILIEDIEYDASGRVGLKSNYIYNEKGVLIERIKNKPNGKKSSHIQYKYDEGGHKEAEEWYNHKGTLYEEKKYSYDESGNMIEEIHYNDDNTIGTHNTYAYDENNYRIEKVGLYSDGSVYDRWEYKCDVYGNRLQESHYFTDEQPECRLAYIYNEVYNISEIKIYLTTGKINKSLKYTYTYY